MVLQGMVNKLAKDEDKEKYARFLLRAYVEGSKKVISLNKLTDSSNYVVPFVLYHVHFFSVNSFITFIISCRLNGVQLLTVHVQWSFLVTRTMMSYAIASSIFAGMYAGSILLMTQLSFSWVLVIKYVRLYQYSLPFAVHRGSSSTSEL